MTNTQNNGQIKNSSIRLLVFVIVLVGGLMPLILYWFIYGQVYTVTPTEAKELLLKEGNKVVLIDVRSKQAYDSAHIEGSYHWSAEEIFSLRSEEQVPEKLRDKALLLICNSGILSNLTTKHLTKIGVQKAINVRGGAQEWIASVAEPRGDIFDRWETASGEISEFPFRRSLWHEQLLAVISGYVIKPLYTLLSLVIVVILWRSKSADLIALRWGLIFFFIGENFCAVNYIAFKHTSYFFEYLHSLGMLLSFGFVTYAVFEGVDSRMLMLSDPNKKCTALSLCRKCIKYEDVPCGLKRTFFMIIPASILLALMPICSDWHSNSYNTMIFGTFYNYSHGVIQQQFEILYCPIIAIVMLFISLLILLLKKENPLPSAKITFAAGIGPLSFGAFRMILTRTYSRNLMWSGFWEETTELIFVMGLCVVLWIFRHGLFRTPQA